MRYGEALTDFSVDRGGGGGGRVHVTTTSEALPPVDVLVGAEGMVSTVRSKLVGTGGGAQPASRGYVVYRGVAEGKPAGPDFSFQARDWGDDGVLLRRC